jgi:hypothetical protein
MVMISPRVVSLSGIKTIGRKQEWHIDYTIREIPGGLETAEPVDGTRLKTIIHFLGIAEQPANPLKFIIFPDSI